MSKESTGPTQWPTCSVCGKELELIGPGITNGFDECCESPAIRPYDPNDPENPF